LLYPPSMQAMRPAPILLSALLSIAPVALPAGAQTTPAPAATPATTTISVDSNLVNLPVTVRDKKGHLVQNLTKADFLLKVDDRSVEVRYFSLDTNLPLTLALDVDTSRSVQSMLDAERTASESFLNEMLTTPRDQAALLHFDREVELLKDLTANKSALTNALDELAPTSASHDQDSQVGGDPDQQRRGGTALYDSVYLAAHDVLAGKPGRKAAARKRCGRRSRPRSAQKSWCTPSTSKARTTPAAWAPATTAGIPATMAAWGIPVGEGWGIPAEAAWATRVEAATRAAATAAIAGRPSPI
jgi:hypothetical protein